jgi:predicted enzyme related to lactoylglutathione lyase
MRPALGPLILLLAACPAPANQAGTAEAMTHFLGLRTAKYSARDLGAARAWYVKVLGIEPYFDQPFYVGFNVGGYELGLVPDDSAAAARPEAGVAYWGVEDAEQAYARLLSLGAVAFEPVTDVGDGIKVGAVRDPFGNILGVIENPHFALPPAPK